MLIPLRWLNEYTTMDMSLKTYTDRLSETGSHVESVKNICSDESIKIGQIEKITQHPEKKNLNILEIKADKEYTIVTSFKELKELDRVLFATAGARLTGNILIEKTSFGSVISEGMLLSYEELGYDESVISKEDKNRVIVLPEEVTLDDPFKYFALDDDIVEFEITPNRPDCLSVIGMARESAASFEKFINYPDVKYQADSQNINEVLGDIKVESDNCKRLVVRCLKDVVVKQSEQAIKNHLMQSGIRPVNNIVDLTNLIMLEYGQPLHAYDLDKLNEHNLIIRDAKEDESITTLDGKKRQLKEGMLVIEDKEKIVSIAGVMGASNCEVDENTKNILLESAYFENDSIRKTSKELQLRSEASTRFEKYVTPLYTDIASRRFMHFIEKFNIGKVLEGSFEYNKANLDPKKIVLRKKRLTALLGKEIEDEKVISILEHLEFEVKKSDVNFVVEVPAFRSDISLEVDLIEEVARIYGIDNIEDKPLVSSLKQGKKQPMRLFKDKLKLELLANGFTEVSSYSFISPKIFNRLIIDDYETKDIVKLINPLGEDFSIMRPTLISGMLDIISKNIKYKQVELKLFEIATTFKANDNSLPDEKQKLCMALLGDYDFYDLKAYFLDVIHFSGIDGINFETERNNKTYHSGRCAHIIFKDKKIGQIGQISYEVMKNYSIKKPVYILEIDLENLVNFRTIDRKYKKLPKYPAIEFDLSLECDKTVESAHIEEIITRVCDSYLESVELFDIYTGNQIDKSHKSLSYKLTFRSNKRTLTDNDITHQIEKLLNELKMEDINLRA